jgi:hypothetical protein
MNFSSPWARACDNYELVDLTIGRPVLDHAEENPDALVAALDNKTEAVIRESDTLRYLNLSYAVPPHSHSIVNWSIILLILLIKYVARNRNTVKFTVKKCSRPKPLQATPRYPNAQSHPE